MAQLTKGAPINMIVRGLRGTRFDKPKDPKPNKSQYLSALALVEYFNSDAQKTLDQARAQGYGAGMAVGVEARFVEAYKVVVAYENRNWIARHFGSKTTMVELK